MRSRPTGRRSRALVRRRACTARAPRFRACRRWARRCAVGRLCSRSTVSPRSCCTARPSATRAFTAGMSPGADVAELNANLDALGYGARLDGRRVHAGDRGRDPAAAGRAQRVRVRAAAGRLGRVRAGTDPCHVIGVDRRGRCGGHGRACAVGQRDRAAGPDPARSGAAGAGQGRRPGHDHAAERADDAWTDHAT